MMNYVFTMMNFILNMMTFILKMMDFSLKMMNFVLKMTKVAPGLDERNGRKRPEQLLPYIIKSTVFNIKSTFFDRK